MTTTCRRRSTIHHPLTWLRKRWRLSKNPRRSSHSLQWVEVPSTFHCARKVQSRSRQLPHRWCLTRTRCRTEICSPRRDWFVQPELASTSSGKYHFPSQMYRIQQVALRGARVPWLPAASADPTAVRSAAADGDSLLEPPVVLLPAMCGSRRVARAM